MFRILNHLFTGNRCIDTAEIVMFDGRPAMERARARAEQLSAEVFASGCFLQGLQNRNFEAELAHAFGGAQAVSCGNGTTAIELALRDLGLRGEDEAIVPANTSLFTAQAVLAAGIRVRFADVDPETLQLTADSVIRAWTPRTKAVVAVHLYGNACPLDELAAICKDRGVALIQDACQAHGLRFRGMPLTAFSRYTCYSFYPTKNLGGVGDGGAIVTDSAEAAGRLRLLRDGGRDGDQWARVPGINSRLSELNAAYLRALLPHLEHWNAHRRRIADVYTQMLEDAPGIELVKLHDGSVRHQFVIRSRERDALRQHLQEAGIETGIHYPHPLHEHPAFQEFSSVASEPTEAARACREVLSLPIGPQVDEDGASRVGHCVRRYRE